LKISGRLEQPCGGCRALGQHGRGQYGPAERQPSNSTSFGKEMTIH